MNRRGFFATLVAAPLAAVAGLRNKGPVGWWGRETVKRRRPIKRFCEGYGEFWKKDDPLWAVHESTDGMVEEMSALGEEVGESFSMSKGLVGFEGIVGRPGT